MKFDELYDEQMAKVPEEKKVLEERYIGEDIKDLGQELAELGAELAIKVRPTRDHMFGKPKTPDAKKWNAKFKDLKKVVKDAKKQINDAIKATRTIEYEDPENRPRR
jgi:hypothetical protein